MFWSKEKIFAILSYFQKQNIVPTQAAVSQHHEVILKAKKRLSENS